jgi:hypothetical protein
VPVIAIHPTSLRFAMSCTLRPAARATGERGLAATATLRGPTDYACIRGRERPPGRPCSVSQALGTVERIHYSMKVLKTLTGASHRAAYWLLGDSINSETMELRSALWSVFSSESKLSWLRE